MRILLSAFACDPYFGSDEEVGWRWAHQLTKRGHEVSVITRAAHRAAIEKRINECGECAAVNFIYHDTEWLHEALRHVNRRNHLYYYFWQWGASSTALALYRKYRWDVVHHVTWVSLRQPSFMWRLPSRFIFGPVAGGDEIPQGYAANFSVREKVTEFIRWAANRLVALDPLMRRAYQAANLVIITSPQQARLLPRLASPPVVALAIGAEPDEGTLPAHAPRRSSPAANGVKLLFAGRLIGWKGMHIGLRAFAELLKAEPLATLTIVGDGPDRPRLVALADSLGIATSVRWRGWLSKDELARSYCEFDLLFYPSLRDSGAFVVLEALQSGLPVVCFDLGGPGLIVDQTCGEAVKPPPSEAQAPGAFSAGALRQIQRIRSGEVGRSECLARAALFTWDTLVERVYPSTQPKMSDGR